MCDFIISGVFGYRFSFVLEYLSELRKNDYIFIQLYKYIFLQSYIYIRKIEERNFYQFFFECLLLKLQKDEIEVEEYINIDLVTVFSQSFGNSIL